MVIFGVSMCNECDLRSNSMVSPHLYTKKISDNLFAVASIIISTYCGMIPPNNIEIGRLEQ